MINADEFLIADKGKKGVTLPPIRCQLLLKMAISKLADGNIGRYCREVLIAHVRKELENKNPKLEDLRL